MNSDTKPNSVFIGEGVSFKGSISAPEEAIIEGQFEGDLSVSNLLIGQTGRVTGTIKADRVDVKGELNLSLIHI
jgi:cytoskeletal protein CcmA (bactofilin family)